MQRFLHAVSEARQEILLVSPFIKMSLVEPLMLNLPANPSIHLKVVTRLNAHTFQQGSSDVLALELLHARPSAPGTTDIYRLDRLHAKIYVFDRRLVFLGSSNMSISGMERNLESVIMREDEEFAHRVVQALGSRGVFNDKVADADFKSLRKRLAESPSAFSMIGQEDVALDDDTDPLHDPPESSRMELPSPPAGREEAIREFMARRLTPDLNSLAGIPFESPTLLLARVQNQIVPDVSAVEREAADRDLRRVADVLLPALGITGLEGRDAALAVFVDQSWCEIFKDLLHHGFQRQHFGTLGQSLVKLEIALHFSRQIAAVPSAAKNQTVALNSTLDDISYEEILSQQGLNVALHFGDIARDRAKKTFFSVVGLQYIVKGGRFFHREFRTMLADDLYLRNITDPFKDPKTSLQELAQQRRLAVEYLVENVGGPDHSARFEAHVRVGADRYGPALGDSKKRAEFAAAEQALAALNPDGTSHGAFARVPPERYEVDEVRLRDCNNLASNLGLEAPNTAAFLDEALTHRSFSINVPSARCYDGLAFIGLHLISTVVAADLLRTMGGIAEGFAAECRQRLQRVQDTVLPAAFERLGLEPYLRLAPSQAQQGLTVKMKRDAVQAVLAVALLWGGIEGAERFWAEQIWRPLRESVNL